MHEHLLKVFQSIMERWQLTKTESAIKYDRQYKKNTDYAADIEIFKNYVFSMLRIAHPLMVDKAFVE